VFEERASVLTAPTSLELCSIFQRSTATMRTVALLGLLCLQFAVPAIAIGVTSCQKYVSFAPADLIGADGNRDNLAWCKRPEIDVIYFLLDSGAVTGAVDPPPPPNPRPRPPPPRPQPPRPTPGAQPASDALWDKAGAKGCTLGWGSESKSHFHLCLFSIDCAQCKPRTMTQAPCTYPNETRREVHTKALQTSRNGTGTSSLKTS